MEMKIARHAGLIAVFVHQFAEMKFVRVMSPVALVLEIAAPVHPFAEIMSVRMEKHMQSVHRIVLKLRLHQRKNTRIFRN